MHLRTFTLTSDDLESHFVVNVSFTLTNTSIWFVAALGLIVDVVTYVRDGWTFLPGLLGHLLGDDLKWGDPVLAAQFGRNLVGGKIVL